MRGRSGTPLGAGRGWRGEGPEVRNALKLDSKPPEGRLQSEPANVLCRANSQGFTKVCSGIEQSREADGLTESGAGAGHLLLKPGEHVGHEGAPSQGSLLGPSLLIQREGIAAPGQAQPPHQLSSNLDGRRHEGKVRPRRDLANGRVLSDLSVSPYTSLTQVMNLRLGQT